MPQKTAAESALPYFTNSIWNGFRRSETNLAANIIHAQGEEGLFGVGEYLAHMLASFIQPKTILPQPDSRFRDEYPFDLIYAARANEFPPTKIWIYRHAGDLALFTATVIPESLNRTPMTPKDYLGYATTAYEGAVTEQLRLINDAHPAYVVLAGMTEEIAEMLIDVVRHDLRMGPTLDRLEEIVLEIEKSNAISEVENILRNID